MSRQRLLEHLREHAIRTDGPFTLRSGVVSDWYLDARQTTLDGVGATLVAEVVLEVLDPAVEAIGGMTMGADPIAVATAVVATWRGRHLRAFSIRKGAKGHGAGGRLVGPVSAGGKVAVIEDTTTTGGALVEAVEVVLEHGLVVLQALSLVDRSGGTVTEEMVARGIPYQAVLSPEDLGITG